jgi:hypothetical protein
MRDAHERDRTQEQRRRLLTETIARHRLGGQQIERLRGGRTDEAEATRPTRTFRPARRLPGAGV